MERTDNTQQILSFYPTRVRSLATLVTHSLTSWLTSWRLVDFIDMTLGCEVASSKLVEVVTVDDVDAGDRVGNSLLPYLIFVISFTQTGFSKTKFYTKKND